MYIWKTLGEINSCKKQQAYTQEWDFVTKQITFIAYISLSKKKNLHITHAFTHVKVLQKKK